jgi:hypothetical protein
MSDTAVVAEKSTKVVTKAAEKIAETNIAPAVVETAEVALSLPSKFVLSGKGASLAVVGTIAVGAGGLYGVQKLLAIRAQKKAAKTAPATIVEEPVIVKKPANEK